jgi:hypothetical protein
MLNGQVLLLLLLLLQVMHTCGRCISTCLSHQSAQPCMRVTAYAAQLLLLLLLTQVMYTCGLCISTCLSRHLARPWLSLGCTCCTAAAAAAAGDAHVRPLYQHMFVPAIGPSLAFVGLPWRCCCCCCISACVHCR